MSTRPVWKTARKLSSSRLPISALFLAAAVRFKLRLWFRFADAFAPDLLASVLPSNVRQNGRGPVVSEGDCREPAA